MEHQRGATGETFAFSSAFQQIRQGQLAITGHRLLLLPLPHQRQAGRAGRPVMAPQL